MAEEPHFLSVGHGCGVSWASHRRSRHTVGERLVAITQIGGEPDGCLLALLVWPCAVRVWLRLERRVALGGLVAAVSLAGLGVFMGNAALIVVTYSIGILDDRGGR